MTSIIDTAWRDEQIADLKTRIRNARALLNAILTGAQSYTLETGERMTVAKANLTETRKLLAQAEAELERLERNANGGGAVHVLPSW